MKAIIFDLDMCIFDTRTLGEGILEPVLEPLRASSVPDDVKREVDRVLLTTSLEDVIEIFRLPHDVAEEMRHAHHQLVVPEIGPKTFGDEDCIRSISLPKILVTSGYRRWQEQKLEKLHINDLFEEIIIDVIDDPKKRKGKRAIFKDLMSRRNWKPHEVLVVGDNPLSELKAAKELGMTTVQTLRPTVRREEGFDHYIFSLDELLPLVGNKPR